MKKNLLILSLVLLFAFGVDAQPIEQRIKVVVAPDHTDWAYKLGEPVKFSISVLQNSNPVKNVRVRYEIGAEKMDASKKESSTLQNGTLTVDGGALKTGGFLRCTVWAEVD